MQKADLRRQECASSAPANLFFPFAGKYQRKLAKISATLAAPMSTLNPRNSRIPAIQTPSRCPTASKHADTT